MDGKVARQLLFKKKLEVENREAEEKLRRCLKDEREDKNLRAIVQEKQRSLAEKKTLMSEIEKLKSVYKALEQEEAIQKLLEIKIHNSEIERQRRLTELTEKMSIEEKRLNEHQAEFVKSKNSVKLQRKTYLDNKEKGIDPNIQEIQTNHDTPSHGKKKTKSEKRVKRETEERKKLLWERAEALKKKRANKLKEDIEEWKKKNSTSMDALEKERVVIERKEVEEKKKRNINGEMLAEKLSNAKCKINDFESAINCIDTKINQIEEKLNTKNSRTLLKNWV